MFSDGDMLQLQQEQYHHDRRNHSDILCLHKNDRLKHYGLHYCKYVGRLARGLTEPKAYDRTLTDTALVCLSAANTLHQHLPAPNVAVKPATQIDPLRTFADAAGRFADACEKIDHAEDCLPIMRSANIDIMTWVAQISEERGLNLHEAVIQRRSELRERQFYITE
ncbi:hypothetical protein [Mesorhizobium sp. M0208]|uniref:hypothetical protein n=1 Tax=unclassified Mesorhizobium TaxID=325217 RepID=UPI0033392947